MSDNAPPRKKLIEVALPLEAINREAAREKSIRHGHPSTLHLWWARRPLAACRAVLFASLVDDPESDPAYTDSPESAYRRRAELFDLIEELVKWENSKNPKVINAARAEIAASVASRKIELGELAKDETIFGDDVGKPHPEGPMADEGTTAWRVMLRRSTPDAVNYFLATHAPPVLDPFAGGGSIPLEAQRLGLRSHASDLNPVAVLINKALIELPAVFANKAPVHPASEQKTSWDGAEGLAEDVRRYGKWMRDEAEQRLGHLYPKTTLTSDDVHDRDDLEPYAGQPITTLAWLWCRTVECPNPGCRCTVPLIKSFALCNKASRPRRLKAEVEAGSDKIQFNVVNGKSSKREGTTSRKGAVCPFCSTPIPFAYIREQGRESRMGTQMTAQVAIGNARRLYLAASDDAQALSESANPTWIPDTDIAHNPFSLRPPLYGYSTYADLFTSRQAAAMEVFVDLVAEVKEQIASDSHEYKDAVCTLLAMCVSRLANRCSTACFWDPKGENVQQVFARQAIAMTWDFVEANPLSDASGSFLNQVHYLSNVINRLGRDCVVGSVRQHDAAQPRSSPQHYMLATDPPYYDNIDYSDLSDFFYVWMRRCLAKTYPELFATLVTPKQAELVATPYRFDGDKTRANAHFTDGMRATFANSRNEMSHEFPGTIVYGFKEQETSEEGKERSSTGWETFLQSLIDVGFSITGTWPLRTELVGNLKGHMNVLASSVILACRKRAEDAPMATRREFVELLRRGLQNAVHKMQTGNIAPVDLAQASIGPGIAIFSSRSRVVNADGTPMSVREALQLINQVLDEVLAEQESDFDAETRFALKWFEQNGVNEGPFGDAETLAKAMAISVQGVVDAGVARSGAGKVRLLKRDELDSDWDPQTDERLTIWEVAQHLICELEQNGETAAGELLRRLGAGAGETARELAYRLYQTCERKKWADEALSYNGLVVSWPEIERLSREQRTQATAAEGGLFESE